MLRSREAAGLAEVSSDAYNSPGGEEQSGAPTAAPVPFAFTPVIERAIGKFRWVWLRLDPSHVLRFTGCSGGVGIGGRWGGFSGHPHHLVARLLPFLLLRVCCLVCLCPSISVAGLATIVLFPLLAWGRVGSGVVGMVRRAAGGCLVGAVSAQAVVVGVRHRVSWFVLRL